MKELEQITQLCDNIMDGKGDIAKFFTKFKEKVENSVNAKYNSTFKVNKKEIFKKDIIAWFDEDSDRN